MQPFIRDDSGCSSCGGGGGRLKAVTDAAGRRTEYEYDAVGRLFKVTYSGETGYVQFGYDAAGRRTSLLDTRLPSELGGQTYTWADDGLGRVASETYPGGGTVSWTYDALGRRRTMTDPDGNVTMYTYANTAGNRRLVSLAHPFSGTTSFSYDSRGRLAQVVPANCDLGTLFEYDALDRLRAVTHGECGGPSAYHREEYTYNAASMRTRIDYSREEAGIMVPDSHRLFAYDRVGRLVEEHKRRAGDHVTQYRYAYTYDPAGNRTQMVHFDGSTTVTTWYSYNAGNQLMLRMQDDGPEWDYVYDANGN